MKHRIEERPILDPHSVIHFLFETAQLKIPPAHVQQYWRHHAECGEEWAQDPSTHQMIPLGIFGDSARASTQFGSVNIVGIFMSIVLFRPHSVRWSRFLLFSIGAHELWKHHTLNTVYRRLTFSFNCLFEGVHPRFDQYGHQLPPHLEKNAGKPITSDRQCFCVTEVRGDWSWHKKVWRFEKTSWTGVRVCHWCPAKSKGAWPELYWNLTEQSCWHNGNFTLGEFIEQRLPSMGICSFDLKERNDCFSSLVNSQTLQFVLFFFVMVPKPLHSTAFYLCPQLRSTFGAEEFQAFMHPLVFNACGPPWAFVPGEWKCSESGKHVCSAKVLLLFGRDGSYKSRICACMPYAYLLTSTHNIYIYIYNEHKLNDLR